MNKNSITHFFPLIFILLTLGCQVDQYDQVEDSIGQKGGKSVLTIVTKDFQNARLDNSKMVGDVIIKPLFSLTGRNRIGYVSYANDKDNLYINFETKSDWYMRKIYMYVGPEDELPTYHWGIPRIDQYNYNDYLHELTQDQTYVIPLSEVGDEVTISSLIVIYRQVKRRHHHSYFRKEVCSPFGYHYFGYDCWANGWKYTYQVQNCEEKDEPQPPAAGECALAWVDGSQTYNYADGDSTGFYEKYAPDFNTVTKTLYANITSDVASSGFAIGEAQIFYYGGSLLIRVFVKSGFKIHDFHIYGNITPPSSSPSEFSQPPVDMRLINDTVADYTFEVSIPETVPLNIAVSATVCSNQSSPS